MLASVVSSVPFSRAERERDYEASLLEIRRRGLLFLDSEPSPSFSDRWVL